MSLSCGRNPRKGTTLLETLVALMLMGLIAALIAPAFGFLGRLGQAGERSNDDMNAALSRMALQRVFHAMPLTSPHPHVPSSALFSGQKNSLEAIAFKDGSVFEAAQYTITFMPAEERLIYRMRPPLNEVWPVQERRLREGVSQCAFTYWSRSKGWSETWMPQPELPELIKISCTSPSGEPSVPLLLQPGFKARQKFKSRSSLVPPAIPSRP
jgi:type II secretory pathway pseudopilin PulG